MFYGYICSLQIQVVQKKKLFFFVQINILYNLDSKTVPVFSLVSVLASWFLLGILHTSEYT